MTTIALSSGERFEIDSFTDGYITAALWSTTDESDDSGGVPLDQNYSIADLAPSTMRRAIEDCRAFQLDHGDDLDRARTPDYNGHDFWLTRNGHGAGFWDRGLGEVGDRLTAAAHAAGEVWWYVGDDGRIYQTGAEG